MNELGMLKKRNTDEWLHRKKRLSGALVGFLAAAGIVVALVISAVAMLEGAQNRKDLKELVCHHNIILAQFVSKPPTYERDGVTLMQLRDERKDIGCEEE